MPRKRLARFPHAVSVRRRLVFDEDEDDNDGGVTFSVGRCVPDNLNVSDNATDLGRVPQLADVSQTECEQFHDLLWTNPEPLMNNTRHDRKHNGLNGSHHQVLHDNNLNKARRRHWEEEGSGDEITSAVAYLIFLISILFILLSFIPWSSTLLQDLEFDQNADEGPQLLFRNKKFICLFGLLTSLCIGAALAVSCCGFSWLIIYFDSVKPGQIPPTPLSPSKYRKKSGHTFHLNYVISIINGLVVFGYYLWLNSDSYMM